MLACVATVVVAYSLASTPQAAKKAEEDLLAELRREQQAVRKEDWLSSKSPHHRALLMLLLVFPRQIADAHARQDSDSGIKFLRKGGGKQAYSEVKRVEKKKVHRFPSIANCLCSCGWCVCVCVCGVVEYIRKLTKCVLKPLVRLGASWTPPKPSVCSVVARTLPMQRSAYNNHPN